MEDDENEDGGRRATRIFVGGLGESVREEDMKHIFRASLGKVETIDFIRTKGRSFAYLDFLPSSPKSLPKLFSTYNGCVWKGGRLKLEKAKEHYLVRLKREWEEDAAAADDEIVPNKSIIAPLQSLNKFLKSEKTQQLQIFFPKLQKVKSLPFSGSGKHKYSFQQIELPPLPIHFCDCDEHYVPSHISNKGNQLRDLEEAQTGGGIDEEELNMMKSVMNKFLHKEKNTSSKPASASRGAEFVIKQGNGSVKLINDPVMDHNETTDEEDEDNLVINIVRRADKRMTTLSGGNPEKVTMDNNQESKNKQFQGSNRETTQESKFKFQEREFVSSNKKRKSLTSEEESDKNESVSRVPKRFGSLQTHARDADILLEPPGSHQSTTSLSWSQKSSWKALLGDNGNNVFSISHVLPGGASKKEEQHRSTGLNTPDSVDSKNQDLSDHGNFGGQSDQSKEPAEEQPEEGQSNEQEEGQSNEQKDSQSIELEELVEDQASNAAINKLARGTSWLQKSSWTQLVSETNNSFSISQILPGITFEKTELPKSNSLDVASFNINDTTRDSVKSVGLVTAAGSSNIVASHKDQNSNALNGEPGTVEKNKEAVRSNNEVSAPALRTSIGDMEIAGTGAFMRSAASKREWAKTKAVLSGTAKRKYNDQ